MSRAVGLLLQVASLSEQSDYTLNMTHLSAIVAGLWRMADWGLDAQGLASWMHACLELGISSMDLAEVYGGHRCQAMVGDALQTSPGLRRELQLITKFGIRVPGLARPEVRRHHYDASARQLREALERALRDLRVERIDAMLIHRADLLLDADELAACVTRLIEQGRIGAFGVSNFSPSQLEMLYARMGVVPFTNQVEANLLHLDAFEDGTMDQAVRLDMPIMAWSPLAGGRLFKEQDERSARVIGALDRLAREYGTSRDAMAYAFLMRHPARIHPITGSGQIERLRIAHAALEIQLDGASWYDLWTASKGRNLD